MCRLRSRPVDRLPGALEQVMNTERLGRLLHELLKEVRALQARAREEPLPRAVKPEQAARLLGCSLRALNSQIRSGRIRTVTVGNEQHVPMSEILHLTSSAPGP